MPSTYKTPGVYIEEIPKFPPSVAQVETAIPAFIGYTEKAMDGSKDLTLTPVRITSILDYEHYFGSTEAVRFLVDVNIESNGGQFVNIVEKPNPAHILYYSIQAFYANGGGPCYIVSVGAITDGRVDIARILEGLNAVRKVDEVTLLICPEAALLSSDVYGQWISGALTQCEELMDRFAVFDVSDRYKNNADVTNFFRSRVPSTVDQTKYGAAYYPFIETSFPYKIKDAADVPVSFVQLYTVDGAPIAAHDDLIKKAQAGFSNLLSAEDSLKTAQTNLAAAAKANAIAHQINLVADALATAAVTDLNILKDAIYQSVGEINVDKSIKEATSDVDLHEAVDDWLKNKQTALTTAQDELTKTQEDMTKQRAEMAKTSDNLIAVGNFSYCPLYKIKAVNNALYNLILDKILNSWVVLPPSSLVAGLIARVDNGRGVWKAPANESLLNVIGPTLVIDDSYQQDLNFDTLSGKSINAIRAFRGKGTLVWGARTLAGNDNEWRYVSVRRFFNMVEESVKKSTEHFVFEPNDANTWIKVRAMIENYLTTLWRQGALAGAKPEHAFYVRTGLGQTMTALDILEGRMIVEIGMAVVRPAEFIILRFSHKMQES